MVEKGFLRQANIRNVKESVKEAKRKYRPYISSQQASKLLQIEDGKIDFKDGTANSHRDKAREDIGSSMDEEDKEEDEDSILLLSKIWEQELLISHQQVVLKHYSIKFNQNEAYQQFILITEVLACLTIPAATADANLTNTTDPINASNVI